MRVERVFHSKLNLCFSRSPLTARNSRHKTEVSTAKWWLLQNALKMFGWHSELPALTFIVGLQRIPLQWTTTIKDIDRVPSIQENFPSFLISKRYRPPAISGTNDIRIDRHLNAIGQWKKVSVHVRVSILLFLVEMRSSAYHDRNYDFQESHVEETYIVKAIHIILPIN